MSGHHSALEIESAHSCRDEAEEALAKILIRGEYGDDQSTARRFELLTLDLHQMIIE